jgi:hypothetical protein
MLLFALFLCQLDDDFAVLALVVGHADEPIKYPSDRMTAIGSGEWNLAPHDDP